MHRYVSVVIFIVMMAWFSSAIAQQDYFAADKCGQCYLTILEGAHVRRIPEILSSGRLWDAMDNIKYTLDRFPNHPIALQQLSEVSQMMKNTSLAVEYFEKAITRYPQYALTRAQYGLFLVSINNVDAGIEKLNQAIEADPKLSAGYAGLAHAYVKKGDLTQAREAANKARELGYRGGLPPGL